MRTGDTCSRSLGYAAHRDVYRPVGSHAAPHGTRDARRTARTEDALQQSPIPKWRSSTHTLRLTTPSTQTRGVTPSHTPHQLHFALRRHRTMVHTPDVRRHEDRLIAIDPVGIGHHHSPLYSGRNHTKQFGELTVLGVFPPRRLAMRRRNGRSLQLHAVTDDALFLLAVDLPPAIDHRLRDLTGVGQRAGRSCRVRRLRTQRVGSERKTRALALTVRLKEGETESSIGITPREGDTPPDLLPC